MKRLFFCVAFAFVVCAQNMFSWEMGFLFANEIVSKNTTDQSHDAGETAGLSFWLSFRPGENTALYFKGSFRLKNDAFAGYPNDWLVYTELDNAQITISPVSFFYAEAGRFNFNDALNFSASGQFDGALVRFILGRHTIKTGAFYTGLLSRHSTKVAMSNADISGYYGDAYFAPAHLFLTLSYLYYPAGFNETFFELNAMYDAGLSGDSEQTTIYGMGKLSFSPGGGHHIDAGAALSFAKNAEGSSLALYAAAGYDMLIRTYFPSRLGFAVNLYYGGLENDAPMPVLNRKKLALLYDPLPSRLITVRSSYLIRISEYLSFDAAFTFFSRLDSAHKPDFWIYNNYENPNSNSFLLGEELSAVTIWTPVSDFSLNLALVFFFPDNGPDGAYIQETPVGWDLRLGVILSF
ncbi:MAG: hypothetical protein LBC77_07280 [Spirochaetaceae bacterium]|nr:hypothetical protein [Spirochaetaceae bacterium]